MIRTISRPEFLIVWTRFYLQKNVLIPSCCGSSVISAFRLLCQKELYTFLGFSLFSQTAKRKKFYFWFADLKKYLLLEMTKI